MVVVARRLHFWAVTSQEVCVSIMRWLTLVAGIGVSLVLSLLLSVFTHTFVFLLFLPLLFVPLLMGSNRSRR